ncbi:putative lipoprotein [compost metagenome]
MTLRSLRTAMGVLAVALLAGCATPKSIDYSAFKQSQPQSIVVLPPLNNSPDVKATYSLLSQVTFPLAEAGYYVLPVALVDETFRQNGMTTPGDIHEVSPGKLREIFGADAALYVTVTQYGTSYMLLSSATIVTASARLVDLQSGTTLWTGSATASSEEGNNNSGGGLVGMLITAAVKQIISSSMEDAAYPIAGITSQRLLAPGQPAGLLYGPRSPRYGTD